MATDVLNPAGNEAAEEREGLQMSFLDHLDELRRRLVYSVAAIMIAFCVCFYFSDRIFNFLAVPVKQQLRKMRIAAQMINGTTDLSQLKEGELAQYTFVQESSVGRVKVPLGTTIRVKSILKDGKQQTVLAEPWAVGKNVLPTGKPLSEILSEGSGEVVYDENEDLVINKVGGAFSLYMTIALYTGIALAIPFLFYQLWAFISPGLYKHEKRYAVPVVLMSAIFFSLGATFAYKIAFARACEYLLGLQQEGRFRTLINAEDYFDLIIMIMLGLGVVFQIPTLSFLLGRIGLVTPKMMLRYWRYAVILIFIIAALLTPTPDAYNLILFAIPMLGLYFVSIGIVWIFGKPRQTDDEYAASS
ncbi:MAG TPA: twin-arginine translocase subunit TatC [Blastocatellia bacterium]|nr:twin-arginine translocase subunit TatC [Blastocatellia bacterium]HMV85768.1 twin-arginine translocase subunit TatC [Blastocatellia bacterium]HMY74688.1 twin-arginine translocase subunit TatC [Blastocatellia bacterium]HMZ20217.1 twin-arginine translocase subunit TatC [Blastocatellia bacterium]HNG32477.1 twin-arginine translocase subunit TatC [Blastocatellia bacterium]